MTSKRERSAACLVLALLPACAEEVPRTTYAESASLSPDRPDAFVHTVARAYLEQKPQLFWNALPESYRRDVRALVALFAEKMDPEIWDRSFRVLRKLADVMGEQKEFMLNNPLAARPRPGTPPGADMEQSWDGFVELVSTLASSELGSLERLRTLDVEEFLAGTGARVLGDSMALVETTLGPQAVADLEDLRGISTGVLHEDGRSALVRVETPRRPAEDQSFLKIEDRWVPSELADGWESGIQRARSTLGSLDLVERKAEILSALDGVVDVLDRMGAARTQAEFDQAVLGLTRAVGSMMAGGAGAPGTTAPGGK